MHIAIPTQITETTKSRSFAKGLKIFFKDARIHQIMYLMSFLLFGLFYLGWEFEMQRYGTIITTCLVAQMIAISYTGAPWSSLKSGMITALGMSLLLHSNDTGALVLACTIAIWSKFLIRFRGRHFFNPGNFGILMSIVITGQTWISPGQWGSGLLMLIFMSLLGFNVLFKVGRIDTGLVFLLVYGGLQFIYTHLYLGWPVDFFYHQMTSGTLLLFAFFMITDPMTTPNQPRARVIWSAAVGLIAFILTHWFYVYTAPIWALLFVAPLTVLFNKIFTYEQFKWN